MTTTVESFDDLGLRSEILSGCARLQWSTPTAIQALSIPPALKGHNIVALAETGSGKTAAYAIPIVQKLLEKPCHFFGLILAPTRELAAQVQTQFAALGKPIGLSAILLVGGIPITQQADQMRMTPPHILIATPGRLLDHLKKTKGFDELKFNNLKFLVIDEADRMLGSDFDSVLDRILCLLPRDRQTFLFSATMTAKVGKLQRASLRDPVFVSTRKSKFQTIANLRQFVQLVPQCEMDTYLVHLLRVALSPVMDAPGLDAIKLESTQNDPELQTSVLPTSVIVFTRTRATSTRLNLLLRQFLQQPVIALNGDMPQAQRLGALYKFKQTLGAVLVATDVASRGLDIPQVGLVVNYDVPLDAKTYMHRVGRTARAGRAGCALTLLTQYSVVFFLKEIEVHLLTTKGNQQQHIPSLVEVGSPADQALESAVAELDMQVKEAAARSNQAISVLNKRRKQSKSVQPDDDLFQSIQKPPESETAVMPGLKRSAWASEAPLGKREEINKVMRSMCVVADNPSALDSEVINNYSKKFRKVDRQKRKKLNQSNLSNKPQKGPRSKHEGRKPKSKY